MTVSRSVPMSFTILVCVAVAWASPLAPVVAQNTLSPAEVADIYRPDNLVAWCIVPFDARKRGADERAAMLARLGFRHFAYDYRAEQIPTFDTEITALERHGIELTAWWFPGVLNDEARGILAILKQRNVHPDLWVTGGGGPVSSPEEQQARLKAEIERLRPIADAAAAVGCRVGLYNHGGWFGEPENQLEILRALDRPNVGIIYNLHHGHDHLDRLPAILAAIKPHLYCLNLNGMNPDGERRGQKILQLGQGARDLELLRLIRDSGYQGRIGILGHTQDDAAERLQDNLDGLAWLRPQLRGEAPGPRPVPRTPVPAATAAEKTTGITSEDWIVEPSADWITKPLTVEVEATLDDRKAFNILVAAGPKSSSEHWEIFTEAGTGLLAVYLPGCEPDHLRSTALVADGVAHRIRFEAGEKVGRLFVDDREVASGTWKRKFPVPTSVPVLPLAIGGLVEGGLSHRGSITSVTILSGPEKQEIRRWSLVRGQNGGTKHVARWRGKPVAQTAPLSATSGHDHAALSPTLAPLPTAYDAAVVTKLVSEAGGTGDALSGLRVFASPKAACLGCHKVGSSGGTAGPELTDVGKRLKPDEIVASVLWPKHEVKPEYRAFQAVLDDGRSVQGYRRNETASTWDLIDPAKGTAATLDKSTIEEWIEVGTLMPEGILNGFTPRERADLFRSLFDLGKVTGLEQRMPQPGMNPHAVVAWEPERGPLDPGSAPLANHPVNRDRIYDFYLKEANQFREQTDLHLLPPYAGLDGGKQGHWGNQTEATWQSDRWNRVDLGPVLAGVYFGFEKVTVPKGVCVRLGGATDLCLCYDPETLSYRQFWQNGFLKFSDIRHGFLSGLHPAGTLVSPQPGNTGPAAAGSFRYLGYLRSVSRIAFRFEQNGVELWDVPSVVDGVFQRTVAPAASHPDAAIFTAPPASPSPVFTKGITAGTGRPYAVDTFELPDDNPWNAPLFGGDHDFLPDGTAVLCTMHGDVWTIRGLETDSPSARWQRIASGLHQPQGLRVVHGEIYILGRDQITRLRDLNGDGQIDAYDCYSNAFPTSPAGHDFICGLDVDAAGNFYTASGKDGVLQVSQDGRRVKVLATGLRNPDGLCVTSAGEITVPASEGDWTPASMIALFPIETALKSPFHFGYQGLAGRRIPDVPLMYLPRGLDNSSGGQVEITDDRWGPWKGNLAHVSFGTGRAFILLRDTVGDTVQGGIIQLPGDFRSGSHRARFRPQDGQLYVSGMAGWGTYTPDLGCFHRVRYTGEEAAVPIHFHVHENGLLLRFSKPLPETASLNPADYFTQAWNYRYSPGYGSPDLSPSHPDVPGHDRWPVSRIDRPNPQTLFLEIPDLQPVNQLHVVLPQAVTPSRELFLTVHRLDHPYISQTIEAGPRKVIAAHPLETDVTRLVPPTPNPWKNARPNEEPLKITAGVNLTYTTNTLRAKPGQPLALTFENPDVVPHNWVLVRKGRLREVGDLANRLVSDPAAVQQQYIPRSSDVLAYTDITAPGRSMTIHFDAPREPGRYPFLCTFPGHWMVMNGELIVAE